MYREKSSPFQIVGRLTLILIFTVALLTVYSNVLARLSELEEDPTQKTLSEVLPSADIFQPVYDEYGALLFYEGIDDRGALVGFGFIETGRGMWGEIKIAGGIDLDYRVVEIVIHEQSETPGLGSRIVESSFLKQFMGLSSDELKLSKYDGKVDAITGATISSRAVTDIVRGEVEKIIVQREGE